MDFHAIDSLMSSFGTFSEKEKLMKNISAREEVSARAPHKQEVKTEQPDRTNAVCLCRRPKHGDEFSCLFRLSLAEGQRFCAAEGKSKQPDPPTQRQQMPFLDRKCSFC